MSSLPHITGLIRRPQPSTSPVNCLCFQSPGWLHGIDDYLGAPPVWNSKELPFKISKDTGISFVDQNAARFSKYPFEPLFRSLAVMQPRFDMKDVDIITDRNSLRKLLHFVSGTVRDPFRINVRLVGGVLFFCRWEPETKFLISGFRDTGFGHNFEKACTFFDPDLKDSSGHHRIVRYKLGGIRCLVRYEADACCGEFKGSEPGSDDEKSDSGDGLLDAFKAMAVTSPDTGLTESVTVVKKGRVVEPSTIVELKSKVAHRKIHLPEVTPQLWFAQTQSLFVGYHNNGRFENVEKVPMGPTFTRWEKDHQHQLQKLVYLIWKLKNLTATSKDNACALVCGQEKPLRMKVYEYLEEGSVLPDSIISQYEWEHANPRQNA